MSLTMQKLSKRSRPSIKLEGLLISYIWQCKDRLLIRQLNVLQRISKFLSEETRLLVFKSFIRSNFNYCPIIWHFCSKVNTEKLEKLQYRGLKIVYNCYESSYEELLTRANLPTLHRSRKTQNNCSRNIQKRMYK